MSKSNKLLFPWFLNNNCFVFPLVIIHKNRQHATLNQNHHCSYFLIFDNDDATIDWFTNDVKNRNGIFSSWLRQYDINRSNAGKKITWSKLLQIQLILLTHFCTWYFVYCKACSRKHKFEKIIILLTFSRRNLPSLAALNTTFRNSMIFDLMMIWSSEYCSLCFCKLTWL